MFIKVIWKPDFQVDYSQEELKTKFCLRFLFLPVTCIQLQIIHLIFNYYIITPLFYGGKFENDPRTFIMLQFAPGSGLIYSATLNYWTHYLQIHEYINSRTINIPFYINRTCATQVAWRDYKRTNGSIRRFEPTN